VEGGVGGLTVSGVSRNRGSFVKCVAIQKRLGIPDLEGYTALQHKIKLHIFTVVKTSDLINYNRV
jgi:hypothetical protein